MLENLGEFRKGKACIYIEKLKNIDQKELKKVMKETIAFLERESGKN